MGVAQPGNFILKFAQQFSFHGNFMNMFQVLRTQTLQCRNNCKACFVATQGLWGVQYRAAAQ